MNNVKIIVLLLMVTLGNHCMAQEKLQWGIRILPQSPKFIVNDFSDLYYNPRGFRIRMGVGAGVLYHLTKRWNIGADLIYSMQGGGYTTRKTNINFLKVPIWLGYQASPEKKIIFNVQIGAEYTTMVRAVYNDSFRQEHRSINRYVNQHGMGISLAIGIKKHLSDGSAINVQLFTNYGITPVYNSKSLTVNNGILPGIRLSFDCKCFKDNHE